ncbi:MAG TPA: protein kinase [Candidatus Saccharimonadaceae bacterium]|nr:protein kinase [Candidatus Saccharimonadaceae bacterium]
MIGEALSHYRILAPLGAGGMGVVYRARDERLEREVALKLLPPGAVGDESARRRLRHEAVALSRLNHPAIATIYAFDSDRDTDFLVMELLAGQTLAERLAPGPMSEAEAVALGLQIAEALGAAHEQGVVHRDQKPSTVMINPRGRAKVLDFGLARLLGPASAGVTSASGEIVGTLAYMAPEQLLGRAVDARADLYALGALLYEMATGRRPHPETELAALTYAVVHTAPVAPRHVRPELSPAFEALVLRALERDPARRFASVPDVLAALQALVGAPAQRIREGIRSLAVLPLANLSGDPAQEFFSDGMTEALISTLAQIGALRVISRTSAMRYKGASRPLPEIARELDVDAIVEGAVLMNGDRVRIGATLIEGATDRHLWARSYEREVRDVLALQSEVARAIADEVRVRLTPGEVSRLAETRPVDPDAYRLYLQGRHLWNRRAPEAVRDSVRYFEDSIAADPTYAVAYSGLADAWNILGDLSQMPSGDAFSRAFAATRRALELDENLAEAWTSLGFLHQHRDWDGPAARVAFDRAIALKPGYASGRHWRAEFLVACGEFEEALAEARIAAQLDPLSPVILTGPGDALFFARRYDEAVQHLRRVTQFTPGFVAGETDLGRALTHAGRLDEAIALFRDVARRAGSNPYASAGLGYALALAGQREEAERAIEELVRRIEAGTGSAHAVASIYLGLGERERALEWLERALALHDRGLVWIHVHPRLDPLRGEPRFRAIAEHVRMPG